MEPTNNELIEGILNLHTITDGQVRKSRNQLNGLRLLMLLILLVYLAILNKFSYSSV
jgi:cell division protein FtsB